ncbi:hypothetical protein [Pseudogemmobacter bohemicus]|uniref:hypothetical protein n=1 Tax=Pseudogemmobacter bohemicus TaxID=2250708 RepID=UPI000DD3DB1F|nr:hypothetical protein [Pseudogemmobacter bohemicus]
MFSLRLFAALGGCLVVAACGGPESYARQALPETVQRNAILECQAEAGMNKPEAIQKLDLRSGASRDVFMTNTYGVTLGQARAINQCKQAKLDARIASGLGGSSLPAGEPATAIPSIDTRLRGANVTPAPLGGNSPTAGAGASPPASEECRAGGGVFQGGAAYCLKN